MSVGVTPARCGAARRRTVIAMAGRCPCVGATLRFTAAARRRHPRENQRGRISSPRVCLRARHSIRNRPTLHGEVGAHRHLVHDGDRLVRLRCKREMEHRMAAPHGALADNGGLSAQPRRHARGRGGRTALVGHAPRRAARRLLHKGHVRGHVARRAGGGADALLVRRRGNEARRAQLHPRPAARALRACDRLAGPVSACNERPAHRGGAGPVRCCPAW